MPSKAGKTGAPEGVAQDRRMADRGSEAAEGEAHMVSPFPAGSAWKRGLGRVCDAGCGGSARNDRAGRFPPV